MSVNPAFMSSSFKNQVATAVGWSALQSWAVKLFSVLLFFVLARYLSPTEMGLAQTVTLALAFIGVVSEQGFHRALVQRPALRAADVNLPFYLSLAIGVCSSLLLWFFSDTIAAFLGEAAAGPLIRLAAAIPPITAATGILVAMFRREMDFRRIAHGALLASAISGVIALALALLGFGALSVVVQAVVSVFVTAVVMWRAPVWRPTLQIDSTQFRGILSYSTMSFASQLVDFFSRRLIDFIILSFHGIAALGVYTVGAKLYLTILELLSATLMEVALSAFSRMAMDIRRLRVAYVRLIFLASCTSLPVFVLVAVAAPEICLILFGPKWTGAITVTQLLCVLGAFEVVQLFNIGVVGAVGNARTLLTLNVMRLIAGASVLATFQKISIDHLTAAYVLSQLIIFPFSFRAAMRVVQVPLGDVLRQILPGACAAALAAIAVFALRESAVLATHTSLLKGFLYIALYGCVYLAAIFALCRQRLLDEWRYIESSYRT